MRSYVICFTAKFEFVSFNIYDIGYVSRPINREILFFFYDISDVALAKAQSSHYESCEACRWRSRRSRDWCSDYIDI